LEKRADIIQHNNTAQQQFLDILENYSKSATELRIREPLHGDLDLEPLTEFGNIRALYFLEGEITSIVNIPPRVVSIECAKNLLTELPTELPPALVYLNVSHNYLSTIEVLAVPSLKRLLLEDNKLESVENLPESLEELNLAQNKLTRLNLGGLTKLSKLNISNNPITIVENMTSDIAEFRMENTPTVEFRHLAQDVAANLVDGIREGSRAMVVDQPMEYKEALNTYFQLKSKYEKESYEKKRSIYEKLGALTNRAARKEAIRKVAELKPKCIHCKRPVGTVFSKKDDHYLAICGDAANPCTLNIDLFNGSAKPIVHMMNLFQEDLNDIKENIIGEKMDILFNYISEDKCVALFNKQMKLFQEDTQILNEITDTYREHFDNEYKKNKIVEKKKGIFSAIERSRGLLTQYQATENAEFLKEAMQIQVNEILPETTVIRFLENEIMEIEKKRQLNLQMPKEYSLFKYPAMLYKKDYSIGEKESVIKMRI
jgi:hypothetical protein